MRQSYQQESKVKTLICDHRRHINYEMTKWRQGFKVSPPLPLIQSIITFLDFSHREAHEISLRLLQEQLKILRYCLDLHVGFLKS
jgi:hypothetical protein